MILQGEGVSLDFKQTISDAPKIARTLVAFANNKGGTLLVGVRDNGSLSGIRSEDERYMLEMAGHMYCRPAIEVKMTEHEVDGKIIIEAIVAEGRDKPYYAKDTDGKWWVYHRVHDKSLQASAVMFQVIRKKSATAGTMLSFSYLETRLIDYLTLHPGTALNEIVKAMEVQRHRIVHSLAKLIYFNILKVDFMNKSEVYFVQQTVT